MKTTDVSSTAVPAHFDLGRRGEELAAAYLEQQGYRLVAANVTLPVGRNLRGATVNAELDLVAYDGPTLCFVEVKTRASDWFAPPQVNVDLRKQRQIARAARAYRHMLGLEDCGYRYDVVSIVLPPEKDSVVKGPAANTPAAKDSAAKDVTKKDHGVKLQIEILRGFWTDEKLRKRRRPERYWD